MNKLVNMLRTSAQADKAKALLSLELLGSKAVGIGDHSTGDLSLIHISEPTRRS